MPKLQLGEPAPFFQAASPVNPRFNFDTVAGRPVFMVFLGSPAGTAARRLRAEVAALRSAFDDRNMMLFFVAGDPADIARLGIEQSLPGIRYFMDYDRAIAARFGFSAAESGVVVLDHALRCLQTVVVTNRTRKPVVAKLVDDVRLMATQRTKASRAGHAPVLIVERVFERSFCRTLIDHYNVQGGEESGVMRERDGFTVGQLDPSFKRRRDCFIEDPELREEATERINRRLVPMIRQAYQYDATCIERHIVARYAAEEGGFFKPHRDNTTRGTAHRRFAVTINLNAEDYRGGDLRFPEFGRQAYRAPTGGALVFSCSLLHEVLPMTKGMRYAYLPFLYGEQDAEVRTANSAFLSSE